MKVLADMKYLLAVGAIVFLLNRTNERLIL
jgi:hypothetical protein